MLLLNKYDTNLQESILPVCNVVGVSLSTTTPRTCMYTIISKSCCSKRFSMPHQNLHTKTTRTLFCLWSRPFPQLESASSWCSVRHIAGQQVLWCICHMSKRTAYLVSTCCTSCADLSFGPRQLTLMFAVGWTIARHAHMQLMQLISFISFISWPPQRYTDVGSN